METKKKVTTIHSILQMYFYKDWKITSLFDDINLEELNQDIQDAKNDIKKQCRDFDVQNFNNLTIFIKSNLPYSPKELIVDMYTSDVWFFHKVFLKLSVGEINEICFDYLIYLQDNKLPYDKDKLANLCKFIKSCLPLLN